MGFTAVGMQSHESLGIQESMSFLYLEVANDSTDDIRSHEISSIAPNDVSHYVYESRE